MLPESHGRDTHVLVAAAKKGNDDGGYKFGDFTRSIGRKVTGDKDYKVRDCQLKNALSIVYRTVNSNLLILG